MKGSYGLIVAAVVGVLGAVLNWIYLQNKTRDVESVSFLGLRDDVTVEPGEPFKATDFAEVRIPRKNAGDLHEYVHLYSDMPTVEGYSPTRLYEGGQLILRQDLRTPPADIAFKNKNQRMVTIEVDPSKFQASLYNPGDQIDFMVPVMNRGGQIVGGGNGQPFKRPDDIEVIGPFTIAHIGDRLGSQGAALAGRARTGRENTVGIFATWEGDQFDAQTQKLLSLVEHIGGRGVRVIMHSRLESGN